jgi:hypothetical protein
MKLRPQSSNIPWLLPTNFLTLYLSIYSRYVIIIEGVSLIDLPAQKTEEGWREVMIASEPDVTFPTKAMASASLVDAHPASVARGGLTRLRTLVSPAGSATANVLGASSPRFQHLPIGSRLEVSPTSFKIARRIGELLDNRSNREKHAKGCALIVDYGGEKSYGSSFRASLTISLHHHILTCSSLLFALIRPSKITRLLISFTVRAKVT